MGTGSLREKVAGKGHEYLDNLSADKLRNNFYGYLLISFLLFNFENIILILKSKDKIEMTLIYIQAQQDFSWNFFWKPLWLGIMASLIMPAVTAAYVVFTGVFDAIRTESIGFGSTLWARVKLANETRHIKSKDNLDQLKEDINSKRNDYKDIMSVISDRIQQKEDLEKYLVKLASVYSVYRNNYSHRDMMGLLDEVDKADISQHFPNSQLIDDVIQFCKDNTYAPAEVDPPVAVTEDKKCEFNAG